MPVTAGVARASIILRRGDGSPGQARRWRLRCAQTGCDLREKTGDAGLLLQSAANIYNMYL